MHYAEKAKRLKVAKGMIYEDGDNFGIGALTDEIMPFLKCYTRSRFYVEKSAIRIYMGMLSFTRLVR